MNVQMIAGIDPGDIATLSEERVTGGSGERSLRETSEACNRSSFVRHAVIHSLANLLALVCSGILTFLIPRRLSMEGYGYYRLFVLYGGFAGVLHFGLPDGALIRWAARPKQRIRGEMLSGLVFLVLQHLIFLVPALAILALLFRYHWWFLPAAALLLYALVWNAAALGQFALQADKSFGWLSAVIILNPALLLGFVVLLSHRRHLTLPALLGGCIGIWLAVGAAGWAVLLTKYHGKIRNVRHVWEVGAHNIRVGWSVLLAGLLTTVVLSLDRVAVSASFGIRDFAVYGFAANALAVVNTIILSVSRVVFPYLSDGLTQEFRSRAYWWGEACLVGLWAISLAGYFPLRWLIMRLLPDYLSSLPVLRLLMLTTGMTAVIYILHTNYFRNALRLRQLLLGCAGGLLAALVLLTLARRTGQLSMMALAMMGAIGVWWLLNELLLQPLTGGNARNLVRTILVYAGCGLWFVFCSSWPNQLVATLAYLAVASLAVFLAYRSVLRTVPVLRVSPPASVSLGSSE